MRSHLKFEQGWRGKRGRFLSLSPLGNVGRDAPPSRAFMERADFILAKEMLSIKHFSLVLAFT